MELAHYRVQWWALVLALLKLQVLLAVSEFLALLEAEWSQLWNRGGNQSCLITHTTLSTLREWAPAQQ
jgi:hypothetical protein